MPVEIGCKGAGYAVAAIDHDVHRPGQLDVRSNAVDVGIDDVVGAVAAFALGQIAVDQPVTQSLDGFASESVSCQHHLEAVVIRRVVAAGYHDPGQGAEFVGSKIQHRSSNAADVDDVGACTENAF